MFKDKDPKLQDTQEDDDFSLSDLDDIENESLDDFEFDESDDTFY